MLFALPYPFLSISTPWGFAYGITALIVLSSSMLWGGGLHARYFLSALVLATLAIHPLAGIPAALYVMFTFALPSIERQHLGIKTVSFALLTILSILAVPAAFVVNSLISSQLSISFTWPQISLPTILAFQSRFSLFLDPVYFYAHNVFFILFGISVVGFFILRSQGDHHRRLTYVGMILFFITLAHAFILTNTINFTTLISYERGDYGMRLVSLAFVFLLPHMVAAISSLASRAFAAPCPPLVRMAWISGSVLVLLASLYLSYPRNDAFQAFHGYNISSADISAVQWIHSNAGAQRFAVLANQVVSSAALRDFGFSGSTFYYPLPTSSPLYEYYTRMMRNPSQNIIEDVKTFLPVSRVYVVVTSYEPRAPLIINQLRKSASGWMSFEQDAVTVFVFE